MKYIGYVRESTKDQAEKGFNLAGQERKIKLYFEYIKNDEHDTLEIIQDGGFSGRTLKRPGVKEIIDRIKKGEIDAVIIHNLDRLTRNIIDLFNLIEIFANMNVSLISLAENFDTSSASGKMVVGILGVLAQWESETISERTKRSYEQGFHEKKFLYPEKNVFVGYKVNKETRRLEIDEKYSGIVVEVFNAAALGTMKLCEIALLMKSLGYPRKNIRDDTVRKFINNQIYIGTYVGVDYKGKKYRIENYCPPIIDEELFKKANEGISKRLYKKKQNYIYYSKVFCSCGEKMVHQSATSHTGTKYKYYKCTKCNKRVEEKVITEEIGNFLEFKSYKEATSDIRYRYNQKIKALNKIKANITNQLEKMSESGASFSLNIIDSINSSIDEINTQKEKIKESVDYFILDEFGKRHIFLQYFDKIIVYFSSSIKYTIIVPKLKKGAGKRGK